jgi:hypothetical protein
MPVSQFSLYDLLVDVIPGMLAILLTILLFPEENAVQIFRFASIPAGAVIIIVASYIVGRLIHEVSGMISGVVENWTYSFVVIATTEARETDLRTNPVKYIWYNLILQLRKSIPAEQGNPSIDEVFDSSRRPLTDDISDKRSENIPTVFMANKVYKQFTQSEQLPYFPLGVDSKMIRHSGYSLLYGDKTTLYTRYNILATFFRNMSFLFWLFPLLSAVQVLFPEIAKKGTAIWATAEPIYLIPLCSAILGIIFSRATYDYSEKRNLHFLLDFYRTLNSEE